MSVNPRQAVVAMASGAAGGVGTVWLPHGLYRFLIAVAVIVIVVGSLLLAVQHFGLIDAETEAPPVEEEQTTA